MEQRQKDYYRTRKTKSPEAALCEERKALIRDEVVRLFRKLAPGSDVAVPAIRFDLKGRAAGQWRLRAGQETLRFNPEAFVLDWHGHFPETVAHEVAHALIYRRHGARRVRPHGREWQQLMQAMGFARPRATHATPLTGRRMREYLYACGCGHRPMSARRHYLIRERGYRYQCRQCGEWFTHIRED
ncbi:SprT-like domain-containing protein [Thioalkalivibrio sp. ALJ16]|uniref:SprT family zinc-dependent metalloprotease n=1 Tax=Thioalkalivibrio sp. ALJ16 TaxID=1158762 RepID=UPI0009D91F20|nr:SprT-like domain-containing protein [Thioalkalivibrio sp. ALJ16]